MNGQSSFTIAPDTILEFEVIGTAWKCVSNEWQYVTEFTSDSTISINVKQYKELKMNLYNSLGEMLATTSTPVADIYNSYAVAAVYFTVGGTVYKGVSQIGLIDGIIYMHKSYDFTTYTFGKTKLYGKI